MATGQLIFQPLKFDWHIEDQQLAFEEWKGQVILALKVSNINRERWYATIIGFLGNEGFKWWNYLPISKQEENEKNPDEVFKAITDTLEVSTSYWNHINEMYSDIKQGEHESIDQLYQHIKDLVERCQYKTEDEKMVHRTELLFYATKHFKVKKMGQIEEKERGCHISSPPPTWQRAWDDSKRHQLTHVQWWNCNSNNHRWNQDIQVQERQWPQSQGGPGKTCSKCNMCHPPRECPAWGKKCHKCGNRNHFSTCCRSRQKGPWDSKRPTCGRSTMRHPKGRARWSKLRYRSRSNTQSAHSIELNRSHSFQDHQESTKFVKKTFYTIYRSKLVSSISNEMDPDGKTNILTILNIKLPHQMAWITCKSKLVT